MSSTSPPPPLTSACVCDHDLSLQEWEIRYRALEEEMEPPPPSMESSLFVTRSLLAVAGRLGSLVSPTLGGAAGYDDHVHRDIRLGLVQRRHDGLLENLLLLRTRPTVMTKPFVPTTTNTATATTTATTLCDVDAFFEEYPECGRRHDDDDDDDVDGSEDDNDEHQHHNKKHSKTSKEPQKPPQEEEKEKEAHHHPGLSRPMSAHGRRLVDEARPLSSSSPPLVRTNPYQKDAVSNSNQRHHHHSRDHPQHQTLNQPVSQPYSRPPSSHRNSSPPPPVATGPPSRDGQPLRNPQAHHHHYHRGAGTVAGAATAASTASTAGDSWEEHTSHPQQQQQQQQQQQPPNPFVTAREVAQGMAGTVEQAPNPRSRDDSNHDYYNNNHHHNNNNMYSSSTYAASYVPPGSFAGGPPPDEGPPPFRGGPSIPDSLRRKFQPPRKMGENHQEPHQNSGSSNSNSSSSSGRPRKPSGVAPARGGGVQATSAASGKHKHEDNDNDEELPEQLQHLEKELVRKIQQEIMESGETISFDDIAGLDDAKQTVQEVVCWPMKRPDLFTGLRRAPNGLLLYGPPGTGKTLIGKAIAHESGATFFSISSSSMTSKWIGEGEKLVKTLFAVAAYREPAVVFIDEIDSLLTQRKATENEASRRMKTEFLVQLDGTGTSGQGRVLVIGATNKPQELDEAARRRFTKRLYIPLPAEDDRRVLLHVMLQKNNHQLTDRDIDCLAKETIGFSGADLKSLCTDAAMGPIRQLGSRALEVDVKDVPAITFKHFKRSLKGTKPSVAPSDLVQYEEWDQIYGSKRATEEDDDDDE